MAAFQRTPSDRRKAPVVPRLTGLTSHGSLALSSTYHSIRTQGSAVSHQLYRAGGHGDGTTGRLSPVGSLSSDESGEDGEGRGDLTRRRTKRWRQARREMEAANEEVTWLPRGEPRDPVRSAAHKAAVELAENHRHGRKEFALDWIREAAEEPEVAARRRRKELLETARRKEAEDKAETGRGEHMMTARVSPRHVRRQSRLGFRAQSPGFGSSPTPDEASPLRHTPTAVPIAISPSRANTPPTFVDRQVIKGWWNAKPRGAIRLKTGQQPQRHPATPTMRRGASHRELKRSTAGSSAQLKVHRRRSGVRATPTPPHSPGTPTAQVPASSQASETVPQPNPSERLQKPGVQPMLRKRRGRPSMREIPAPDSPARALGLHTNHGSSKFKLHATASWRQAVDTPPSGAGPETPQPRRRSRLSRVSYADPAPSPGAGTAAPQTSDARTPLRASSSHARPGTSPARIDATAPPDGMSLTQARPQSAAAGTSAQQKKMGRRAADCASRNRVFSLLPVEFYGDPVERLQHARPATAGRPLKATQSRQMAKDLRLLFRSRSMSAAALSASFRDPESPLHRAAGTRLESPSHSVVSKGGTSSPDSHKSELGSNASHFSTSVQSLAFTKEEQTAREVFPRAPHYTHQIVIREDHHLSPRTAVELDLLRRRLKGLDPEAEEAAERAAKTAEALAAGKPPPVHRQRSYHFGKVPGQVDMKSLRLGDRLTIPMVKEVHNPQLNIRVVDLTDNRMSDEALKQAIETIGRSKVQELRLSHNTFSSITTASGTALDALCKLLRTSKTLRRLHLAKCGFNDRMARRLCAAMVGKSSYIDELNVSHNNIGELGGMALARMIENPNTNLMVLDASWNHLRGRGVVDLGKAFAKNTSLRAVNFAWNSFGDKGTQALAKALEQNMYLESLDLSANHIAGATVMVLANMLIINDTLESLQLNHNTVGKSGARALLRAASTSGDEKVTAIGLEDCNFHAEVAHGTKFNPSAPGGRYKLNLKDMFDRTIAADLARSVGFLNGCSVKRATLTVGGQARDLDLKVVPFHQAVYTFAMRKHEPREKPPRCLVHANNKQAFIPPEDGQLDIEVVHVFTAPDSRNIVSEGGLDGLVRILQQYDKNLEKKHLKDEDDDDDEEGEEAGEDSGHDGTDGDDSENGEAKKAKRRKSKSKRKRRKSKPKRAGGNEGAMRQQLQLLSLAADSMYFSSAQIEKLVALFPTAEYRVKALVCLLPRLVPNRDTRISRLVYNMLPDRGTRYDLKEALGPYYWFSAVCPNGRYALALQYPIHRALVVKIMELANAEKALMSMSGRADTSQRNDWMPFRNESLDGRPIAVDNAFVSRLPTNGLLMFDFSTSVRPPQAARTAPLRAIRFLIRYCGLRHGNTFGGMTVTKGPHEISVPTLFDPREEDISNHDNGGDATTGNQLDDLSTLHTPAATEDLASKLRNLQGTTATPVDDEEDEDPEAKLWDKDGVNPMVNFRFGGDDDFEDGWDEEAASNMLWDKLKGNISFVAVNERMKRGLGQRSVDSSIHSGDFREQQPGPKLLTGPRHAKAEAETDKGPLMFRKLLARNSERVLRSMPSLRMALSAGKVTSALSRGMSAGQAQGSGKPPKPSGLASAVALLGRKPTQPSGNDMADIPVDEEVASVAGDHDDDAATVASKSSSRTASSFAKLAHALGSSKAVKSGGVLGSLLIRRSSKAPVQRQRRSSIKGERIVVAEEAAEHHSRQAMLEKGGDFYDAILRQRVGLLRSVASLMYFNSIQAVRIARRFPAMIKNARVEALCVLSSRVVDGGLFLLAEQILKPDEVQELVHRLGYLNLVNPWQPDHYYDLDLSKHEHRKMAEILIDLAIAEPGKNWVDEMWINDRGQHVPGWELPATWPQDMPHRGSLKVRYTSERSAGCRPDIECRELLLRRTSFGSDTRRRLKGYFPVGIAASMLTIEDGESTVVTSLNTVSLGDDEDRYEGGKNADSP